MNNKNYFIFAAAIALASCSVDEYMGENPEFTQTTKENIIGFGGGTGSMSRATSNTGTPEQMLDYQFKVYGWKTMSDNKTQKVFEDYSVWYKTDNTPSNPNGDWEYVGNLNDTPTTGVTLNKNQYIKYWDYSATDYRFVAGSPISAFTFNPTSGKDDIASAFVEGLGGHLEKNPINGDDDEIKPAPVYIANPVKITKGTTEENNIYGKPVKFNFTRLQTKVRVGIYETIPGYTIKSIEFYDDEDAATTEGHYVILFANKPNYFVGGSNITGTVTYNWNTAPSYSFEYENGTNEGNNLFKKATTWYGGEFAEGIKAISSNPSQTSKGSSTTTDIIKEFYGEDKDMDAKTGYFIVLPTPSNTEASALTLKCNYTLESEDGSPETINVKGATAAIPAAYCKWEPNKMYTYIFKISQETNGTTGTPGTDDPAGLFPITFDAVATAEENTTQGYETIINTPSITTYQDGSVTANGIEYKIKKPIVVTVTDNSKGNDLTLNQTNNESGCLIVYNCGNSSLVTEADLQASGIKDSYTKITGEGNISVSGTKATFTPQTAGYYAIQYCSDNSKSPVVYKYKVIKVVDPSSGS